MNKPATKEITLRDLAGECSAEQIPEVEQYFTALGYEVAWISQGDGKFQFVAHSVKRANPKKLRKFWEAMAANG